MNTLQANQPARRFSTNAGYPAAAAAARCLGLIRPSNDAPNRPPWMLPWRKQPPRRLWLKTTLLAGALSLLGAASGFAASFSYSASVNKIYVFGTGSATLTQIQAALPAAPLTLVDGPNKIWLLSANVVVQDGCSLLLHGAAVGGDVNQLRLLSANNPTNNDAVFIEADYGTLDINSTKITSWDTNTSGPVTNLLAPTRAYIAAMSSLSSSGITPLDSSMFITNSELCFLGSTNSNAYGVVWKVTGADPNPTNNTYGVVVFGSVVGSRFHDNYDGAYTYGASNMVWLNNVISNNANYGLDVQDYSSVFLIQSNSFIGNDNDGLLAGTGCSHLMILGNSFLTNDGSGILLEENATNNLLGTNLCVSNSASGISLDQTGGNTVQGNLLLSNNEAGLRLTIGSAHNLIQSNQCADNKYGFYLYPGSGTPNPGDDGHPKWNTFIANLVQNNASDPILCSNSDYNTLATNNFADLAGKLRFVTSLSNWLDGNLIGSGLTVRTEGDTNDAASTYVRNVSLLNLELVTNVTVVVEDAQNRLYQPNLSTILTTVSSSGSVLTLTADTNVSTSETITARDFFANASPGSATVDELQWTNNTDYEWKTTPGSVGQTLSFTVGGLVPNTNYNILRGSFILTNLPSGPSGQVQFSDVSTGTTGIGYEVATVNPNQALFSYSPTLNKLYVYGGGSGTLSQLAASVSAGPLTLVDPINAIWLLSANLVVQDGSKLILHGTAVGGDVNELQILSLNSDSSTPPLFLEADYGSLDLNSTKITSWDTITSGPNTNSSGTNRAYIAVFSSLSTNGVTAWNSRLDITNSELCFLGGTNSNGSGVVWKVSGVDPNPTNDTHGVLVFGNVVGSFFHDNYIGAYTDGATNMLWLNNVLSNNGNYGLDLQDYSSGFLIQSNRFLGNDNDGILAGSDCSHLTILGNTSVTNDGNGITLNQNAGNSLLETNRCVGNTGFGIALDQTFGNTVQGNVLSSNLLSGLRLTLGSANNLIQSNLSSYNASYGFNVYPGSGTPNPGDNGHPKTNLFVANWVHDNGSDPLLFTNADYNTFATNNFTDLTGKLRFGSCLSNWLDGNTISTGLSLLSVGDTNVAASTYVRNASSVEVNLGTNAITVFEDSQNRIYDPDESTIPTTVSSAGSVMTLTPAEIGASSLVVARNFFVTVSSGSASVDELVWTNNSDYQWKTTPGSIGQTLSFTVGGLIPNTNYNILRGSFIMTNLPSGPSGQVQFSDVSTGTTGIGYEVATVNPNQALFSYSPTLNKLYVYGGGSGTLSQLAASVSAGPLTLVDPTNAIWLLTANLVVQDGSKLILHGTAVGGDVNELQILSLNSDSSTPPLFLEADYGSLDLNSTKITSWDTITSGPNTNSSGTNRAYIAVFSSLSTNGVTPWNSRLDITNSELCFLGGTNSNGSGVVWKVSGVDPNPTNDTHGVLVFGNVVGSRLHDNNIGAYTFGASNMLWLNNVISNNAEYGLDMQDYSSGFLIQSNSFLGNGDDGLLVGTACSQLTILANTVLTNAGSGIVLDQNAGNNLLETNRCSGNVGHGIALDQTFGNTVQGNVLTSNLLSGLRLTIGSAHNLMQSNLSAYNASYGIYAYPDGGTPNPGDDGHPKWNTLVANLVHDNGSDPILFTNADFNTLSSNTFSDLSGKLRFESCVSNWLDGDTISMGMSVLTEGDTNVAASTYVSHESSIDLQLGTNGTAIVADSKGRIYQPNVTNDIATAVSTAGSTLTLTPALVGASTTVMALDFYVAAGPGTTLIDQLIWTNANSRQWTATPASSGQALLYRRRPLHRTPRTSSPRRVCR